MKIRYAISTDSDKCLSVTKYINISYDRIIEHENSFYNINLLYISDTLILENIIFKNFFYYTYESENKYILLGQYAGGSGILEMFNDEKIEIDIVNCEIIKSP